MATQQKIFYSTLVSLHLEYCAQFWGSQYRRDVVFHTLGSVRTVKRVGFVFSEERLRELRLLNLEERRLREILSMSTNTWEEDANEDTARLFSVALSARGKKKKAMGTNWNTGVSV